MPIRLLAVLLAGVAPLGSAAAAEIAAASRIDAVTVHPGAATVTRVLAIDVPAGQHALVVSGLPQALDPNSLRVEGASTGALRIGSVEMRTQPLANGSPPAGEVAQRLKILQEGRARKQAEIQALAGKQAMIASIGGQAPAILGGRDRPVDPAEWVKAWDAVGQGLRQVNEELTVAQQAMQAIDEEIAALGRSGTGPRAGLARAAHIAVEAAGDLKATLKLTYQVDGATWRPSYDAALSVGGPQTKPKLVLVRRAVVSQRTGEDWTDVAIVVSTARAKGGSAVPDVPPIRAAFQEPPAIAAPMPRRAPAPGLSAEEGQRGQAETAQMHRLDAQRSEPALQSQAQVELAGFSAQFAAPGRVSIASDGGTRSFRLTSREIEPSLGVKTAPGIDAKAYLEVGFSNDEDAPLMAGEVSLTRDGVYVGQGHIGQIASGDSVAMGFGVDDKVKVTRAPLRRRETEPSWIQGSRSDLREFRTVVRNLHDRPMRITVLDQIPFAENAAITVETTAGATAPTDKNLEDKRGVLGWSYDYKAGEEREIRHGYRIRWPGDREIVLEPAPNR